MSYFTKALYDSCIKFINDGSKPDRILIPAPTHKIAKDLQTLLVEKGITSYLVVDKSVPPSSKAKVLHADSLTSLRLNSFVAITAPGQVSRLPDSVTGSGGAIRELAFSDEWPWVEKAIDGFSFESIISCALHSLGLGQNDFEWIKHFISRELVNATKNSSNKSELLFDEIISGFSLSPFSGASPSDKFFMHCGVPAPADGWNQEMSLSDLCHEVFQKTKDPKINRNSIKGKVSELDCQEEDKTKIIEYLDPFFDGLGVERNGADGVLAISASIKEVVRKFGVDAWRLLNQKVLFELFLGQVRKKLQFKAHFENLNDDRSLLSNNATEMISIDPECVKIKCTYSLPQASNPSSYFVTVSIGNLVLYRSTCLGKESVCDVSLARAEIPDSGNVINITCSLNIGVGNSIESTANKRLKLHHCSPLRPRILVVGELEKIEDIKYKDDSEIEVDDIPSISVNGKALPRLYLFSYEKEKNIELKDDSENLINLFFPTPYLGLSNSNDVINPTDSASGQVTINASIGGYSGAVILEAKDVEKGQFTIEDEFRTILAQPSISVPKLNKLLNIFEGDKKLYTALGGSGQATQLRSAVSKSMERDLYAALPILLDFERSSGLVQDSPDNPVIVWGSGMEPSSFSHSNAQELFNKYRGIRQEILELYASHFELDYKKRTRPVYADCPQFIFSLGPRIESLLEQYLKSYIEINKFLLNPDGLGYWDVFSLSFVDCVVDWSNKKGERGGFFLLGPWHPLVLSKRYMVQRSLFYSAKKYVNIPEIGFNRFAELLNQTDAFKWLPCIRESEKSFEWAYISSTSDPGWLFGYSQGSSLTPEDGNKLNLKFGLSTEAVEIVNNQLTKTFLENFCKAYPSNRHLSLTSDSCFLPDDLVAAAQELLYKGEEASERGMKLTGGVSIVSEDPSKAVEWREPPIRVYSRAMASQKRLDMTLLKPCRETQFLGGERHSVPRGTGSEVVYFQPHQWVENDSKNIPCSFSLEGDGEHDSDSDALDTYSELFLKAIGLSNKLVGSPSPRVGRVTNLPQSLEAHWTILPGQNIDPAVYVRYAQGGGDEEERALWDYHLNISGGKGTYYVLSTIPKGYSTILGCKVLGDDSEKEAKEVIRELGGIGIAIGTEMMRTGNKTKGVIGLIGAVRLFHGGNDSIPQVLRNDEGNVGFIIPVDPFEDALSGPGENTGNSNKRGDLLVVQLTLPNNASPKLTISATAIECKYTDGLYDENKVADAHNQARKTVGRFGALVEQANKRNSSMPERLCLLNLITYGLHLYEKENSGREHALSRVNGIVREILQGNFEFEDSNFPVVLVSTEGALETTKYVKVPDLWVRLAPGGWPGVDESNPALTIVRKLIADTFIDKGPPVETALVNKTAGEVSTSDAADSEVGEDGDSEVGPIEPAEGSPEDVSVNPPENEVAAEKLLTQPKMLIGATDSKEKVFINPDNSASPLENRHIMVTGSSGKGKTQLLKSMIMDLSAGGVPVFLLDFKKDFVGDQYFLDKSGIRARYVSFEGLPYNPLIPAPVKHPGTGKLVVNCGQHISGIAAVIKNTFKLGEQQEATLKNVIRECFVASGIQSSGFIPYSEKLKFPDFNDVGLLLKEENPVAYNRLDPLFDLGIFSEAHKNDRFDVLLGNPSVMDLSGILNDAITNAIARMITLSAHRYYNSIPHASGVRQFFIFDEAHRVLESDFIESFVRESRAYGVGLIMSSQYPSDFPADVSASMGTKIILGNGKDSSRVKAISNLLRIEECDDEIANLEMFEAVVSNRHYSNVFIRALGYPLQLVYAEVMANKGLNYAALEGIKGIDSKRLSIEYLTNLLMKMGLIQDINGKLFVCSD